MLYKEQQNIKVHLAGMEETMAAQMMHEAAGFNYALFSVLSYIGEKAGINAVTYTKSGVKGIKMLESKFRHVIMDSGLFSLMFGAHAAPGTKRSCPIGLNTSSSLSRKVDSVGRSSSAIARRFSAQNKRGSTVSG